MAKRTASSKSDKLFKQLMPLRDDPGKVYEALARQDLATIGVVVAKLLGIAAAVEETEATKRSKPAHTRPAMPAEAFVEVVRFADRDTLDSMQLACRSMRSLVSKMEIDQLALRPLSQVRIGRAVTQTSNSDCESLPSISRELDGKHATIMKLGFDSNLAMIPFMRLAYCKRVFLDFVEFRLSRAPFDRLFVVLVAQEIRAESLVVICRREEISELVTRSVHSFKSVTSVTIIDAVDGNFGHGHADAFTDDLFVSLARQGVRTLAVMMRGIVVDVGPALAFGFAEPESGGWRQMIGARCANGADLLEQVRRKASELDGADSFDFGFSTTLVEDIEPTGFERYQTDEGEWLISDLENRVTLEIQNTGKTVEIQVISLH